MNNSKKAKFRYYGLAPFEIEVIYSTLKGSFDLLDEQLPIDYSSQYVSIAEIEFPVPFGESFFQFFTMERWYKIKGIIKEMKRRRGKKGIKAFLLFCGIEPGIKSSLIFLLTSKDNRQFEMSIEKIEYLVDIIPLQLEGLPANIKEITCSYDEDRSKWSPLVASGNDSLNYFFKNNEWKENK